MEKNKKRPPAKHNDVYDDYNRIFMLVYGVTDWIVDKNSLLTEEDTELKQENEWRVDLILRAIEHRTLLTKREKQYIKRWIRGESYADIARKYKVSRQTVSQVMLYTFKVIKQYADKQIEKYGLQNASDPNRTAP